MGTVGTDKAVSLPTVSISYKSTSLFLKLRSAGTSTSNIIADTETDATSGMSTMPRARR